MKDFSNKKHENNLLKSENKYLNKITDMYIWRIDADIEIVMCKNKQFLNKVNTRI